MEESDLIAAADKLERLHNAFEVEHAPTLRNVAETAATFQRAWSGSNLGYHSLVYYYDFAVPPPGAHFSVEWGLRNLPIDGATQGNWREYLEAEVLSIIRAQAGNFDQSSACAVSDLLTEEVRRAQPEIVSVLSIATRTHEDTYLQGLQDKVEKITIHSAADFAKAFLPHGQINTRDSIAASQGLRVAPHQTVVAEATALCHPSICAKELASISRQAGSHLIRLSRQVRRDRLVGTNVFIGHGRSLAWRVLKDFIKDRLGLPYDEFNRVPVAGVTNIARLSEMLDASAIALIILTAEDEQVDGTTHARMNVIHEVGLFQGRLGFTKAIALLEEGCEEFSNIQGLGQIRFPKGNIAAAFEEVRLVLEREKLLLE